jgi:triosephosphate isomerase
MREFIVAANWKMNGDAEHCQTFCQALVQHAEQAESTPAMVLFPAIPYLSLAKSSLANSATIALGTQSISSFKEGAYTGEVSATMARDVGASVALIGHSERRQLFAESNEIVIDKTLQALSVGLRPMICLGESLEARENNETHQVLQAQLLPLLQNKTILESNFVLAYEPVWAIGTGLAATPAQANEAHQFIRSLIGEFSLELAEKTPILYGGSVKPENAGLIFAEAEVDGALIGGASLNVNSFWEIATCTKFSS